MALTSADLLTPTGEIDGALFYPSVSPSDVSAHVGVFLTQGYAAADAAQISDDPTRDLVARRWSYYRAWSDVVNRITLTPASMSLAGEVSTTMLQTQIDAWIGARDAWRAAYEALVPSAAPAMPANPVSMSVPNCFVL